MADQERDDEKAKLEALRRLFPGGQIPAKELYRPDSPSQSMQGPMEVARATFDNCKIKKE